MSLEILFCQGIEVWALQVSQNVDLAAQPSDGLSILCYIVCNTWCYIAYCYRVSLFLRLHCCLFFPDKLNVCHLVIIKMKNC